ncbi:conserved [Streptomyces azureus]|uniref:Conserved n=2 Tax=Streptomyces azureus TaxID=146537 RepID=A0A0K8PDA3_STRAJ|nr:conserved [Streptomyces azureus]
MKALVREAAAADIARHRALQEGAEAFRRFFATHADEFAAAFPDDESPSKGEGRAA